MHNKQYSKTFEENTKPMRTPEQIKIDEMLKYLTILFILTPFMWYVVGVFASSGFHLEKWNFGAKILTSLGLSISWITEVSFYFCYKNER